MSNRTAQANIAIAKAWEKEQQRVREGTGTRDWTQEQQKAILEYGKAYDENGDAFQGQHMRSAEMYPESQGNPDNIQFLTRKEHLAAHDGNWQNPTNWYYDPVTTQKTDFGNGPVIPCEVIELSSPVARVNVSCDTQTSENAESKKDAVPEDKKISGVAPSQEAKVAQKSGNINAQVLETRPTQFAKSRLIQGFVNAGKGIVKVAKATGKFCLENPEIIGAIIAIGGPEIAKAIHESRIRNIDGGHVITVNDCSQCPPSEHGSISKGGTKTEEPSKSEKTMVAEENNPTSDEDKTPQTHSSPREHTVSAHGQHYNTKKGVVWKQKEPYPRGGKNDG